MDRLLSTCFSLAILLFSIRISTASDSYLLKSATMEEFIDSKEQVSGSSTIGAFYVADNDQVRTDKLYAYVNEPISGELLLEINSIDGRYSSKTRYTTESAISGWVRLDFPTRHKDFVGGYSTSELAGLLTDKQRETLYPLRWGQGADADVIRLYINSERARTFFYTREKGRKQPTYCMNPSAISGFKFNNICDVPVASILRQSKLNIYRRFGVRPVDPIQVELSLPDTK